MVIDIPGNDTEWNYTLDDLLGQQVKAGVIPAGQKIYDLDLEGLNSGMYLVTIYSGTRHASQKIMVK